MQTATPTFTDRECAAAARIRTQRDAQLARLTRDVAECEAAAASAKSAVMREGYLGAAESARRVLEHMRWSYGIRAVS